MSFKKVTIDQSQEFPTDVLRVEEEDGPNYPLLEYRGFGSRPLDEIKATTENLPRKVETIQSKLDALIASTAGFLWLVMGWPISLFITEDGTEWQFDHRHLARAMRINSWVHAPVALYKRRFLNEPLLDGLSDSSVMTLSGLYIHSVEGSNNAKMKDYYIISQLMEEGNIPRTKKNVDRLLEISGSYQRFPSSGHKSTIGTIRKFILENKKRSQRVFNTSKDEVKRWMEAHPLFGFNNRSKVDGVLTYHKVLDNSFTYRYANDILRWCFMAWLKGETVRVCASSKSDCEYEIEAERQDIIDAIKDILENTVNWYISWAEKEFSRLGLKLPKLELDQLPLELWWIPQMDGEDPNEGIRTQI